MKGGADAADCGRGRGTLVKGEFIGVARDECEKLLLGWCGRRVVLRDVCVTTKIRDFGCFDEQKLTFPPSHCGFSLYFPMLDFSNRPRL